MARLRSLQEVKLEPAPIDRFHPLVEDDAWSDLEDAMSRLRTATREHTVWNINSTAKVGGVAELLNAVIPYSRGAGVDERWVVIEGSPEFFNVTKKLHTLLHGVRPGGEGLTEADKQEYERTMQPNAAALLERLRPGDVAILHDPQTAGLVQTLRANGVRVIWRSHIGVDVPNDVVREAWTFLRPHVAAADAVVFSRQAYVWEGLVRDRVEIIPPCIDPFAAKNRDLDRREVAALLVEAELPDRPRMILQVSRWDRLKDPVGVLRAFAEQIAPRSDAWLMLAGPAVRSVEDDPEQPEVLEEVLGEWGRQAAAVRDAIVVAQLPMDDVEHNAMLVNALQRRAEVVVQKSLAEGFGLTVAEAMWKGRPVVASRLGGIEDQIEHGRSGILVDDPHDLPAFGDAVLGVLGDQKRARALGREARRRVVRRFITPCHLAAQGRLIARLAG